MCIRLIWTAGEDGTIVGRHNDFHVATVRPILDENTRDHWTKEYTWEVIGGATGNLRAAGQCNTIQNGKRACRKWYARTVEEAGLWGSRIDSHEDLVRY